VPPLTELRYASNTPAERRYIWLDLPTMAAACGTERLLLYSTTVDAPRRTADSFPVARPIDSFLEFYVLPTTHMVYASTWAMLSVAGAAMTYLRFLR